MPSWGVHAQASKNLIEAVRLLNRRGAPREAACKRAHACVGPGRSPWRVWMHATGYLLATNLLCTLPFCTSRLTISQLLPVAKSTAELGEKHSDCTPLQAPGEEGGNKGGRTASWLQSVAELPGLRERQPQHLARAVTAAKSA